MPEASEAEEGVKCEQGRKVVQIHVLTKWECQKIKSSHVLFGFSDVRLRYLRALSMVKNLTETM